MEWALHHLGLHVSRLLSGMQCALVNRLYATQILAFSFEAQLNGETFCKGGRQHLNYSLHAHKEMADWRKDF